MGLWSSLLGIGGAIAAPFTGGASLIPSLIGAGGAAAGAISSGMAHNRGEEYGGQLSLEQMMLMRERQLQEQQIAREQEGRTGREDAWRKLLSAQRVTNPSTMPVLSPYAMPQRKRTGAELEGADALTQEVLARLKGGNPIPEVTQHDMQVDPSLLKSGAWEKILGGVGAGGTAIGMMDMMRNAGRDPRVMSALGSSVRALPPSLTYGFGG